jgi:hypothetical protein
MEYQVSPKAPLSSDAAGAPSISRTRNDRRMGWSARHSSRKKATRRGWRLIPAAAAPFQLRASTPRCRSSRRAVASGSQLETNSTRPWERSRPTWERVEAR